MSATTISPGPWKLVDGQTQKHARATDSFDVLAIVDANGNTIVGHDYFNIFGDNQARDLPIILAAPDMLAALQGILAKYADLVACGDCGHWDIEGEAEVIAARAAIKKAMGETP